MLTSFDSFVSYLVASTTTIFNKLEIFKELDRKAQKFFSYHKNGQEVGASLQLRRVVLKRYIRFIEPSIKIMTQLLVLNKKVYGLGCRQENEDNK